MTLSFFPAAGNPGPLIVTEVSATTAVAPSTAVPSALVAAPAAPLAAAAPTPLPSPVTAPIAALPAPTKLLRLHASADSWIQVTDARGQVLLARLVHADETVDLDGAVPMRLRIGNARGTDVVFRGQELGLAPYTRDNLARLELK